MLGLPILVALSSCVLLASHASVLSNHTDDHVADPTAASIHGISFAAKATPNSDKGSSDNHTLTNGFNMEYTGKVNVGGHDYTLIIDTGSSDLWIMNGQKLALNGTTNTTLNLTYGIGSAAGPVVYAPVTFGGYHVDAQALLVASKTTDQDAEGILGLGLPALSAIQRTTKNASAQAVMANLFAQHPDAPHLLGLALERTEDGEDTAGGFLTIGDYDPQYRNVTRAPEIPLAPTSTARWTVALEGMSVDGRTVPLKSGVRGAQKGEAIALVDSGTSLAYIPPDAVDAIYSHINGSVHVQFAGEDAWFVPCLAQVNLSFTFAHIAYPINPLELTVPMRVMHQNDQYTVCVNAFRGPLGGNGTERDHDFDFLLGDVFMRNVYSVFNFGNTTHTSQTPAPAKNASIQFLSRTNRDQVYTNFRAHRIDSLRAYPPLFDLTQLHPDGTTDDGGRLIPPSQS